MGDAANGISGERNDFVFTHQAREAALDPEHLPPELDRREDSGSDDCVEPGSVAPARRDCNSHGGRKLTATLRSRAQQREDLTRTRVALQLGFLEDGCPVGDDLEAPTTR